LRYEITRQTRVKARLEIDPSMLADFFFREETGRIDYALIVTGVRAAPESAAPTIKTDASTQASVLIA
jgi:hypothetical protein